MTISNNTNTNVADQEGETGDDNSSSSSGSDVCHVARSDDESLPSVDEDLDDIDGSGGGGNNGNLKDDDVGDIAITFDKNVVITTSDEADSFPWGTSSNAADMNGNNNSNGSSLYQAMLQFCNDSHKLKTSCNTHACHRTLVTPSAMKADENSKDIHEHVQSDVIMKYGTDDQKSKWNSSTYEQQLEYIAAFFFHHQQQDNGQNE